MKKFILFVSLSLFIAALIGCGTTPKRAAFNSFKSISVSVDNAMMAYADAVIAGKVTLEQRRQVAALKVKYNAAMESALALAQYDYSQFAPQQVIEIAAQLVNTVNAFIK